MPLSRLGGLAFLTFLSVTTLADTQAQVSRTQADDRNSLSGVVVTKDRPDAVRQVTVVAAEASTGRLWSTMTDDGGAFRISELPPGEYTLSARKPAYLTSIYGALEAGAAGTRIRVPLNGPIAPLRLSIARGGVIAGMVRGMDGEPAPDVVISVMGASGWSTAVWTNFRGEYRVYGLPADAYAVSAKPESALTPKQMGQSGAPLVTMPTSELDRRLAELARRTLGRVATSAPPTTVATAAARSNQSMELVAGLPDVFYPGSVALGEGEEVTNIDLMLSLAGGASVNVTVLDEQGQPAATARVSARAFPRGPSAQVYGGRGANGTFRVANMIPGRYLIEAWIDGASGSGVRSAWANAVADLTAGTAGRVTLTLQPAMSMRGRVVLDPPGGPARISGTTRAVLRAAPSSGFERTPRSGSVRPDGTFEIQGILPGVYHLALTSVGSDWVRSAMAGGRDLMDSPIEFDGNTKAMTGVVVTLSNRHTAVSGAIRQPGGVPARDLWIVLFPADRRLWSSDSRRVRSIRPSTEGSFVFRDVPPGDYFLAAVTTLKASGWATPDFLELVAPGAVKIRVREGEEVTQDIETALPGQR